MDIGNEIKKYLYCCKYQKKLSDLTLKAYAIDLRQFLAFSGDVIECLISKAAISGFIRQLHQNYLPRTAKRKIASLRAFLNYLEFEEIISTNPMRKIPVKFQEPKQLPKTIPLRLIKQILIAALREHEQAQTPYGIASSLRDRVILEILFATGMRVSELCSLKKDDVNLEDGTIRIIGKGTKERIIQIENNDIMNILQRYQNSHTSKSGFFLPIGWTRAIRSNPYAS
jgi:integrase/recombinase XerD